MLANEQVIDGRGWRTGAPVEKREIPMYFFRITHYAEELLDALEALTGWPEQVKLMQKNWIGRSEGVRIGFEYFLEDQIRILWVFTTRADTLMGTRSARSRPSTRIAAAPRKQSRHQPAFIDECRPGAVHEAELAKTRRRACRPACRWCTRSPAPRWTCGWATTC